MLAGVVAATPAPAEAADNPWLERRVLHFAHQGGEFEAPSNTMYAFKTSLEKGADVLELDVNATADDRLVVIHDRTVDRTTNGTGRFGRTRWRRSAPSTRRMTSFPDATPSRDSSRPPIRCVGCGRGTSVHRGFRPSDFRIPTSREVLRQFPGVPINIEIKGDSTEALHTAALLAVELLRAARMDLVVVSFDQAAVDAFHAAAPRIPVAPGVGGMASYILGGGSPGEGVKAFQVPLQFTIGGTTLDVATPES